MAYLGPYRLDARRLLCPLPMLRAQERANQLPAGVLLEVVATDPGVVYDIPAWCRQDGHTVRSIDQQGRDITLVIEVGGAEGHR